jgi:hypothetical protein
MVQPIKYNVTEQHSTYEGQQSHNRATRLRPSSQIVLYAIDRPLHTLLRVCITRSWIVYAKQLQRLRVSPLLAVDGDEVEELVMADAVHGET